MTHKVLKSKLVLLVPASLILLSAYIKPDALELTLGDFKSFVSDTTRNRITIVKGTEVLYVIYPTKVNANELTQVTKEFQKEGFSLSFAQSFQNNEISELTINSNSRDNQGSVTFNLRELRDSKRVIQVKGDTRSGEIFVNASNIQ